MDYIKRVISEKSKEENIKVNKILNLEGKEILQVEKNNSNYLLGSMYNQKEMVEYWVNQAETDNIGTVILVMGMASGEYIDELKHNNSDISIIVYEPSYAIAELEYETMNRLASTENISVFLGSETLERMVDVLYNTIEYESIKHYRLYVSPNYDIIFPEEYEKICEAYRYAGERRVVERNTRLAFNKKMMVNICNNIPDAIEQYPLSGVIKSLSQIDFNKIPAILVASGPSLDKNIDELKKAKGHAFILCVDTALKVLDRENIIPDLTISVDPEKKLSLFEIKNQEKAPIVLDMTSNSKIKDVYSGKRIYSFDSHTVVNPFLEKYGVTGETLATGGSVANNAFSLLRAIGFKTIIFVGQDLAYSNEQTHATGIEKSETLLDIVADKKEYLYVEDIFGNTVKTDKSMDMYRKWFENQIKMYPNIKCIDATEGGAKKNGMEIMTLKAALERECDSAINVDFRSLFDAVEPTFTEEQKREVYQYLANYEDELKKIRDKLQEGKKKYEKLDEFNRKHKYTGAEFNRIIEEISKLNDWVTNSGEISDIELYTTEKGYEVKEEIYDKRDGVYQEIKMVVENGIKMMDSYIDATSRMSEDMKDTIETAREMYGRLV